MAFEQVGKRPTNETEAPIALADSRHIALDVFNYRVCSFTGKRCDAQVPIVAARLQPSLIGAKGVNSFVMIFQPEYPVFHCNDPPDDAAKVLQARVERG